MNEDLEAADRYIERAEECRVIASTMSDPRAKRSLMAVSDGYLQMAKHRVHMHAAVEAIQRATQGDNK